MTLISVIIPCYNSGECLERAILSVLDQTYPHVEIVVQDNHSQDEVTTSILKKFENNIKWHREKDSGIYDAFNKGIGHAQGEWLYFMGADDRLANAEVFQKLMSYLFHPKYRVATGDVINENRESTWVPERFHSEFGWKMIWKNSVHQQGCIYRKDCFDSSLFDPQWKVLGDYQFHLKLNQTKGDKLTTQLVFAHCEATGISKQFNSKLYTEELRMKKSTLPPIWYALNIPWITLKRMLKAKN
jgi:glycosyltransferase involved in cell wall biosynthesis